MVRRILLLLAVLLVHSSALAEIRVTDMVGREVVLAEGARKVVALTAADCEIVCALGAEATLVGRGEYCDYPPSVLDVPAVSSGAGTNIEVILALEPDLVIMGTMAQTTEQADALLSAGIPTAMSDAQNIEGVYASIRMTGALLDRAEEAEAIIARMESGFQEIREESHPSGSVYFEVSPLEWGLWTAGSGTFMDELAGICGLSNLFDDVEEWAQISEEQVLSRDPDYIVTITMYNGEGPHPEEEIASRAGWQDLKAVKDDRILNADYNIMSRPGPRLSDAARVLADFIRK